MILRDLNQSIRNAHFCGVTNFFQAFSEGIPRKEYKGKIHYGVHPDSSNSCLETCFFFLIYHCNCTIVSLFPIPKMGILNDSNKLLICFIHNNLKTTNQHTQQQYDSNPPFLYLIESFSL